MTYSNFTSKTCTKCNIDKPLVEFSKHKNHNDGMSSQCRLCVKEYKDAFKITKEGVISIIYSNQKQRSVKRNHIMPNYSKDELQLWALSQPIFNELYNVWVKSGYLKYKRPSFDRINDLHPYSFDNMQIMTWKENEAKGYSDRKNGTDKRTTKAVIQKDLSGKLIRRYHSIRHASRSVDVDRSDLSRCCRGIAKTAGGFKWSYADG